MPTKKGTLRLSQSALKVGGEGLEGIGVNANIVTACSSGTIIGGAKCGALDAQTANFDADLQAIIDAWDTLSPEQRQALLEIIRQDAGKQ